MSEQADENTRAKPNDKSPSASFRKIIFVGGTVLVAWVVFGQIVPRLMFPVSTSTVKQELGVVPTENQPLKRQSFQDILDEKDEQITSLRTQAEQFEARLKTLEEKAASPAPAMPVELHENNQALKDEIRALQDKIAVLEARPTETEEHRQRMALIEATVGQQQDLIKAVKDEIANAQLKAVQQLSALSSFVPMKEAVLRGENFDTQLTQVLNFSQGNRKVEELAGQLKPVAKQGTSSFSDLRSEFDKLLLKAFSQMEGPDSFTGNLRSLINIRKTGEQLGTSDEAIFARAESRLAKGDIEASLKELAQLSPSSRNVMAPWVERAKRYLFVRALLDDMQLALTQNVPTLSSDLPATPANVSVVMPAPEPLVTKAPPAPADTGDKHTPSPAVAPASGKKPASTGAQE